MLTADLVRVRQQQGQLSVSALKGKTRQRALELASLYLQLAAEQVGSTYGHLKEALASVEIGPREKKLAQGLAKLIEDQCEFETSSAIDPRELRSRVFLMAARLRREHGRQFDRRVPFERLAEEYQVEPESLESALYSDLRSEQRFVSGPRLYAEQLVERYDRAQYQAVLLRAVSVIAHVRCKDPNQYRLLFRRLKFHRLLFSIQREDGGYRIEIDGPFSLFDSVTKYGLQLALVFPTLCECDELRLSAKLRWGKQRTPLTFHYDHLNPTAAAIDGVRAPDEVQHLLAAIEKQGDAWKVTHSDEVFDLPGVGLCIPDLRLEKAGAVVYVEVLGFWSRDAVFKRVELVEGGLAQRIVFAVSSRLRVSEAVLGDRESCALYVYKGVMSAKAVLGKAEELLQRRA